MFIHKTNLCQIFSETQKEKDMTICITIKPLSKYVNIFVEGEGVRVSLQKKIQASIRRVSILC